MSTWLFDLGNTRLKCAPLLGNGGVGDVVAIAHDGVALAPDWLDALPSGRIEAAFVVSVVPAALRAALFDSLGGRCARMSRAGTLRRFDGVEIAYAQPQRLGADRFLALLAAHARGARPWLVAGVGTALTIDLLDAAGLHRGGRIAPSPMLMRQALHARAAQLPESGGRYIEFADDTDDALASGCEGAAVGLIERSLRTAEDLFGAPPGLLLHGGGAAGLQLHFGDAILAPALVLEGLARWACAERDLPGHREVPGL